MDITELTAETKRCLVGWRAYEKDLIKAGMEGALQPTAVGWKVADLAAFSETMNGLLTLSNQFHVGTVNDRLIGSFILKQPLETEGIRIIKVLQRRPDSTDELGLDHIDFYVNDLGGAKEALRSVKANWQIESNDVHEWISVRFGEVLEYEAKFIDHTVLRAGIEEMKQAESLILS